MLLLLFCLVWFVLIWFVCLFGWFVGWFSYRFEALAVTILPPSRTPEHNPVDAVHLLANPASNWLIFILKRQSHVQKSQRVHTPDAGRDATSKLIPVEAPDTTARGGTTITVWYARSLIAQISMCGMPIALLSSRVIVVPFILCQNLTLPPS